MSHQHWVVTVARRRLIVAVARGVGSANGYGVTQDCAEAVKWSMKAAVQGIYDWSEPQLTKTAAFVVPSTCAPILAGAATFRP